MKTEATNTSANLDTLAGRFALERVSDGGVLVDLQTGSYFQVNASAAEICGALLDEVDVEAARARVSARLNVDLDEAASLIEGICEGLGEEVASGEIEGPLRYGPSGDAFGLEEDGCPVLLVDPATRGLMLAEPARVLRYPMLDYVRTITPKLLGLLGFTVLHASACRLSGGVVGFSGQSGAGKTTTMQAFASAGGTALAEDLLVLRDAGA
ncbi:MAG: hypothetical protein JWM82_4132, partial [Myxococcales bacterium]|nr:hypothetical protein [Myxococcales bacterium]